MRNLGRNPVEQELSDIIDDCTARSKLYHFYGIYHVVNTHKGNNPYRTGGIVIPRFRGQINICLGGVSQIIRENELLWTFFTTQIIRGKLFSRLTKLEKK